MPTALQGFRDNNRERRAVGPPCQHSRAFSASGKGLKRWPLILSSTLRRRTALGFTRDRHINYASRLKPTRGAPSRSMAAGSVSLVAVLRGARTAVTLAQTA